MFAKLNVKFNLARPPLENVSIQFGETVDGIFKGITYYHVDSKTQHQIKKIVLPETYHKDFVVLCMLINRNSIPAHTDSGVLASINLYLDTADAVTKFYNVKNDNVVMANLSTQTDGRMYAYSQLEFRQAFKAEPGEAWLLNVKLPHSVHCKYEEERFAYVVQTDVYTFDQVKNILIEDQKIN